MWYLQKKMILFAAFFFYCFVQVSTKGCSLEVKDFDSDYMPIIVGGAKPTIGELVLPKKGKIDIGDGKKITLSCPNKGNALNSTRKATSDASCVDKKKFKIDKNELEIGKIVCQKGVRGESKKGGKCGKGSGATIQLGFPTKKFSSLIEVCYNEGKGSSLYAQHELIGSELKYASKTQNRPSWNNAELGSGIDANKAYTKEEQKSTFNKLLGKNDLISDSSFLAKGHLAPVVDFIFLNWQYVTFFYVNAVPQWQQINNGNWRKIENMIRRAAINYDETFQVYTGTHQILKLPNDKKADTELYLTSDKKVPVPKFIWKIVVSKKTNKAIALISLNNPFAKGQKETLCKDVCKDNKWDNGSWNDAAKGLIHCCDAKELLKAVPTGLNIKISGVLSNKT